MLCALLAIAPALNQTPGIVLYQGAEVPASGTKYWSAEDIQIDRADPTRSSGQGLVLFLGKDKRALIRFADLQRALGPNKKIVSAKLTLTPAYITSGGMLTLRRFGASWHDGPGTGGVQPKPSRWSTSWDYQFYGEGGRGKKWRDGGREYLADTVSAQQAVETNTTIVELTGLGSDVQAFYDRWFENNGWALEFSGDGAFNSAENGASGVRLEIVTEDAKAQTGADLSVTYIERTPEYKRYDSRGAYSTLPGETAMGVMTKPGEAESKKWPSDGEEVTYVAHIKNVGTADASGFSYDWTNVFSAAGSGESTANLAPGQETTVTLKTAFKNESKDHRTMPIGLRIHPKTADSFPGNDFLEIQANALNFGIYVDQAFYDAFSREGNQIGTKAFEDWIQWQFRIFNDVFLKHSRFSFAEDGAKERVRIGRIMVVPTGSIKEIFPTGEPNLVYDGELGFSGGPVSRFDADRDLLYLIGSRIGLTDLDTMNVPPMRLKLEIAGRRISRGAVDTYAGLMGGGDTRNDLLVPAQIAIPNTPTSDVIFVSPIFRATDLLSRTDVAALESDIGYRRGYYGEYLYSMPKVNVIRVTDRNGVSLGDGTLKFYQMQTGEVRDGAPAFIVDFKGGVGRLPENPAGPDTPFTTLTGHTLAPNPFGRLDVSGNNGTFLIRLDYAGQTEFTWLKAWQLFDMFARGNKNFVTSELRFNVTHRPVLPQNWALRKTAIDSANSDGSNLAALIDGDSATAYTGGNKTGDWIEIDIGRDRPIGEIRLISSGEDKAFWERFDVMVYGTGQTVASARLFAGEASWNYASRMLHDVSVDGELSVAYRAAPQTVRFIRIVNKSGGSGTIADIEVRETEPPK
jgi:hypothetical protein